MLLRALLLASGLSAAAAAYGDSAYGRWVTDAHGNPAFAYTGGAPPSPAPGAVFPAGPDALLHSAGNDRVSALLFADGSVTLRQDEGGAKLLQGYRASARALQFRGGVGYLASPARVLAASAVAGAVGLPPALPLNLTLGMGYAAKRAPLLEHTVLAPFGSAAAVLSLAAAAPAAAGAGALSWTEVWASGDRWELGWGADAPFGSPNATAWQAPWGHAFEAVEGPSGGAVGLVDAASCGGSGGSSGAAAAAAARRAGAPPTPSAHDPDPRPAYLVCLSCLLPGAALRVASFTTRASQLYCAGGERSGCSSSGGGGGAPSVESPLAPGVGRLLQGLDNSTAGDGQASVLALQVAGLQPGAPPLAFLAGYLTVEQSDACAAAGRSLGACVLAVAAPYATAAAGEPARTALAWQRSANDLQFGEGAYTGAAALGARAAAAQDPTAPPPPQPAPPPPRGGNSSWEGREAAWHSYSLRAALSFDTFFGEPTLNQNGNYLLVSGQNAAARDPLAHVMGLAWGGASAAPYVPAVLRTTLAQTRRAADAAGRPAGSIKWGLAAFGLESSAHFNQSDIELALLLTLAQYVLGTRDAAPLAGDAGEGAWRAFLHHRDVVSRGAAHGLARLLLSDHNDGLLSGLGVAMTPQVMAQGESGMNAGLAAYALELYAQALEVAGGANGSARAGEARAAGDAQRAALAALWEAAGNSSSGGGGGWYPRAWLGPALGWRGSAGSDGVLWTETQAWALLGRVPWANASSAGGGGAARAAALVATLAAAPLALNPFGALNTHPDATVDGGVGYGGVWACGGTALVAALGLRGWGGLALAQWRKASLAAHAEVYPHIYFGATSGPDVVNSEYAAAHGAVPGSTRCAWNSAASPPGAPCNELAVPVLNSWPHTLGSYPLPALAGAEFGAGGLTLAPSVPAGEGAFTIFTPLVSLAREGGGGCSYAGHWAPNASAVGGGVVSVRLRLAAGDLAQCASAAVNGGAAGAVVVEDGAVLLQAPLREVGGVPMLVWSTSGGAQGRR